MKIIRGLSSKLDERDMQLVNALKNIIENLDKAVKAFQSALRTKRKSKKLIKRIKQLTTINLNLQKINGELLIQIEHHNQSLTLRSHLMDL